MNVQESDRFQEVAKALPSVATFAKCFVVSGKTARGADVLSKISQLLNGAFIGPTSSGTRRIEINANEIGLSALNRAEFAEVMSALNHAGYKVETRTEYGPDGKSVIMISW
jgi:hypothetical protein